MVKEGKSLNIKEYKESWSEYIIEDGTVIKLKPVVTKITLVDKKEKKYNLQIHPVVTVENKNDKR